MSGSPENVGGYPRPITDDEVIIRMIAARIDYPSVFMGGPSKQSMRTAATILPIVKEYADALLAARGDKL